MASKLERRDIELLNAHITKRVGQKPYEDGLWGTQGNRDFVYFEILDSQNNLIEFKNLSLAEFSVNTNSNIEFYPGKHITELGFDSGTFKVKYHFLRKLAGDDISVLVRTKTGLEGDIYNNLSNIYITDDGKVYIGTEEQFRDNGNTNEQLAIEDLRYQIDEISPSRKEVRLKAKNINGDYILDFVDIQTSVNITKIDSVIDFIGNDLNDSNVLTISPDAGGFLFTQKMVDGTVTIPNTFKVNEIQIAARTETNFIKNPSGESYDTDSFGDPVNLKNKYEWDASLHADAISVKNWSSGFNSFAGGSTGGTAAVGYHARWVIGEGMTGGTAMKFPDQNDMFTDLDIWPSNIPHRWLGISQRMNNLQGQGVTHGDIVNVSLNVKSTVAGKGVQVSLRYADEMIVEDDPTPLKPTGYFDPNSPDPTETMPTHPPTGYMANSSGNATAIEPRPPARLPMILITYNLTFADLAIGDTTAYWGGAGAWIITQSSGGANPVFVWSPNLGSEGDIDYTLEGTLSNGGEWEWDGSAWVIHGNTNSPSPPVGSVNPLEWPDAINSHPYQLEGQGSPLFRRDTTRGLNSGWQTGTQTGDNGILIKDDLVWITEWEYTTDYNKIQLHAFDDYFIGTRDVILDNGSTLYEDIFANGFIQSITRVPEGGNDGLKNSWFLIFYNNGDIDENSGVSTIESNKYFYIKTNVGVQTRQGLQVQLLKDLDSAFNDAVIDNNNKMEWSFKNGDSSGTLKYYAFIGDLYWRLTDGDNGGDLIDGGFDSGYPQNRSDNFAGLPSEPDVMFPKRGWSRYNTIVGDQVYRFKSSAGDGIEGGWPKDINLKFYGVGERGTNGAELVVGSRNSSATNYNSNAIYDDGSSEFDFDPNPLKIGFSTANFEDYPIGSNSAGNGLWTWDGQQWNSTGLMPPRFHYTSPNITRRQALPTIAGEWQKINLEIEIPDDWKLDQKWYLYIYGQASSGGPVGVHGVTWVDDLFMDFTLRDQSITQDVFKPFTAQIASVSTDGKTITVSRNFKQNAIDIGVDDEDPETEYYDISNPGTFPAFQVSYLNLNPMDLRTYLKFDNNLFLTTNFKQDKISVENYPHSVVYKLYKPLPNDFKKFDECIIVKEMANPLEETIKIIDFVPEETGKLVLKSPDLKNVESPIQARTTDFKTETDILTDDAIISTELRNEFLSQSIDSVELNTDYSRYENFVNFSSAEKRIRNFKYKLELIEDYRTISSSYIGVSGSSSDLNKWNTKIHDIKNNLDSFEKYMYFESSSYVSSSLGIFYDNSWPVAGGSGTLNSPYILAHTTSSKATTWFSNAMISSSNYDAENLNKLSNLVPEYIKEDPENQVYLDFTDMVAQHFDNIWIYINSITDTFDRREKLTEGISKDLLGSVAKSLGWNLNDGKDLVPLTKFALGKEVTGSAYSDYSTVSERDLSREIWSRIINNMPFFLKNKGTIRALKGLINIYGIPSTILRVKEYGGPDVPDSETPQFEITRKFTKALDFKNSQYVKTAWSNDGSTSRKPDTVEFRFRAATGSNQILVQKEDDNNQDWYIRLKDNDSTDNYGFVSFMLSGSQVGASLGQYKEVSSSALPIYDGDFYSVMVRRMSGSDDANISQSYELNVGKYDSSRSKIHLYSSTTMDVTHAASSSFSNAWTGSGEIYIGGSGSAGVSDVGSAFTGSIMEYRHWTETLNTGSFKNHIGNPKAYDGNTVSSSYNNLVLRYSFDDNKDLSSDTEGIRDVSSNQTTTYSGSHSGFSGNFFRSVVDELKSFIPSIGALRRTTNKIRLESNSIKPGQHLQPDRRATVSAYDSAPTDSNKVGIFFAPTDVINNDIINSVANLNFDNYLGDPRDKLKLNYRGLDYVADNYWKKYTSPNNFWDYIRLIKYYDQSLYPQLRKMIPARTKADIGLLIEPNIFERPKVIMGRDPDIRTPYYSSSINIGNMVDGLIQITSSYNHDRNVVRSFNAYDADIRVYSYETGSMMSSSGAYLLYEASSSEARDRFLERSLWQRLSRGDKYYSNVTMSFGDTISGSREVLQPVVSGSRIYGRNQKLMSFYSSSLSASLEIAYSSSYYNVDLDNLVEHNTALFNRTYAGSKNVVKTSADRRSPVEVIITAPTKLVTAKTGDSTLTTGDGMVSDFKERDERKEKLPEKLQLPRELTEGFILGPKGELPSFPKMLLDENGVLLPEVVEEIKEREIPIKKLRGLKGLREAKRLVEEVVETDADRKRKLREKRKAEGRPKRKTKRKTGTAKRKKKFVEDKKAAQTRGAERKETTTRQKRIKNPVYKKKVTPPVKRRGKTSPKKRGGKGRK